MARSDVQRCGWVTGDPLYVDYHDREWGVPVRSDRRMFEFLILEGVQAGLSWITVLKKRENYRRAFAGFDPERVARFGPSKLERLMQDSGLIRNRAKMQAAVGNAKAFLRVQEELGSFSDYLWQFVGGETIVNRWREQKKVPATSKQSDAMAKDLKQRGFRFVGSTICYAHMQATGMVNDHLLKCFRHAACGAG